MKKMRGDAAADVPENGKRWQIGRLHAHRKIRMRIERQLDRPSLFHPTPRHGEVIRELVERRWWRLRGDERGDGDQREYDAYEWRTGNPACPDRQDCLSST